MNTNNPHYLVKYLLICCFITNLYSHSRVAFSRPGMFIRTPSSFIQKTNNYFIGLSTEIVNLDQRISSKSIHFKATNVNGFEYGVSYSQRARLNALVETPKADFSFHFNKEVYNNNNFIINVGVQDILYHAESENQLSAFLSLINKNINLGNQFKLQTAVGFGTGKINSDSYDYSSGIAQSPDFFAGLQVQTPLFKKFGGMQILCDYDGSGLNIASSIRPSNNILLKLGITHFENIVKFNTLKNKNTETIYDDSPGLSIGLDFKIPTKSQNKFMGDIKESGQPCYLSIDETNWHEPLSLNVECGDHMLKHLATNINQAFQALNDSLLILNQDLHVQEKTNASLNYETKMLQDSIYMQYLNQRISQSEINLAMKHLSNSLQSYYLDDYNQALYEADEAQKYLPNLAYIYARKGSIYYKLGDIDRATINWNVALQLDPEYIEVRQMLASMKTNNASSDILPN